MEIKINIKMGNSAFGDGCLTEASQELARILKVLAHRAEHGVVETTCVDHNGNTVGHMVLEDGGVR